MHPPRIGCCVSCMSAQPAKLLAPAWPRMPPLMPAVMRTASPSLRPAQAAAQQLQEALQPAWM